MKDKVTKTKEFKEINKDEGVVCYQNMNAEGGGGTTPPSDKLPKLPKLPRPFGIVTIN